MRHPIILCAILIAGIFTSCSQLEKEKEEQEQEKIVKITPMFSAKVQQYIELGSFCEGYATAYREITDTTGNRRYVYTYIDTEGNEIPQCHYEYAKDFSEGLAAVRKDGKYGYINTKGEVVLPFKYSEADCFGDSLAAVYKDGKYCYINREGVEVISIPKNEDEYAETILTPFCEDLAFVIKPNGWEYFEYYAIDKTGKKLFEGKLGGWCAEEGGRFNADYIPKIQNGEVYVPSEDYDTYDVYNKQGQKLRTEKSKPLNNGNFEIIAQKVSFGKNEYEHIVRYGMKEIKKDSTDTTTTFGHIPVIYDEIHELKNGVALVCLYEYDKDALIYGEVEGGYIADTHYGYADLYGNDTFSDEIKRKCARSFDKAETNLDAYKEELNNPQWLKGTWRVESNNGYIYRIFNDGKCITYFQNYPNVQEGKYSLQDGIISIEGEDASMTLDCERDIVRGADWKDWSKISNSTTIDNNLKGANVQSSNSSNSDNDKSYYGTLVARNCTASLKALHPIRPMHCYFNIYYDGYAFAAKRLESNGGKEVEDEGLLVVYINPEFDEDAPYNSMIKDHTYAQHMIIYKGIKYYLNIPGVRR